MTNGIALPMMPIRPVTAAKPGLPWTAPKAVPKKMVRYDKTSTAIQSRIRPVAHWSMVLITSSPSGSSCRGRDGGADENAPHRGELVEDLLVSQPVGYLTPQDCLKTEWYWERM